MNSMKSVLLLLACGLTACASLPPVPARNVDPPDLRPPSASSQAIERGHELVTGTRGLQLFQQWWRPVGQAPRAAVVVVHGLKDHGSRYGELAARLVSRGFAVHALDLRGHAHSEGARVDVDAFDDYVTDLGAVLQRVRQQEPGKPVFLLGHSMGGAIVTLFTLDHPSEVSGLITHAAALRLDAGGAKVGSIKFLSAINPKAGLFQLDLADFSRDPEVVRAAQEDPLVYQPAAPVHTARELIGAVDRIQTRMEELTVPVLILHGTADKVTPAEGSKDLYRRARSTDKTLKLYPELYHDLVHEPEKETVLNDITAWLETRAPSARPATN